MVQVLGSILPFFLSASFSLFLLFPIPMHGWIHVRANSRNRKRGNDFFNLGNKTKHRKWWTGTLLALFGAKKRIQDTLQRGSSSLILPSLGNISAWSLYFWHRLQSHTLTTSFTIIKEHVALGMDVVRVWFSLTWFPILLWFLLLACIWLSALQKAWGLLSYL